MYQQFSFYDDLTQIAENRIKELVCDAEQVEAQKSGFPDAASYLEIAQSACFLLGEMSQKDCKFQTIWSGWKHSQREYLGWINARQ